MKHLFFLIFTLVVGFSNTSCINFNTKKDAETDSSHFNIVTINDEYRIGIPKYMRRTTNLNDEASLQYQNLFKEAYTIIIDEPKDVFVDALKGLEQYDDELSSIVNYRNTQLQLLAQGIDIYKENKPTSLKINGMDAEMIDFEGTVEGINENIYYLLTFVENDNKIYMIMSWTLADKKQEHKKTFETIAQSFEITED